MIKYVLKRLLYTIPVMLGVTWIVFTIMYFTPGDPARMIVGMEVEDSVYEAKVHELGLDQPYWTRLFNYVKNIVLHFDFGSSYFSKRPVAEEIALRFPFTFRVASLSILVSLVIGIPIGVVSAVHQYGWQDNVSMGVTLIGVSMPNFWVGQMLVLFFAVALDILPASGVENGWISYILPCATIGIGGSASIARQTRSSMLETIRQDYIATIRAKGVAEKKVIYQHALKNALIPIITTAGTSFGVQLGGAMISETVFSIPGLGTYMLNGINSRDYPTIQGSVLFVALTFSLVMLAVDLLYAFVDPRIKAQYAGGGKKK